MSECLCGDCYCDPASYMDTQDEADLLALKIVSGAADENWKEAQRWKKGFRELLAAVRDLTWALDNGMDEYTAIERLNQTARKIAANYPETFDD